MDASSSIFPVQQPSQHRSKLEQSDVFIQPSGNVPRATAGYSRASFVQPSQAGGSCPFSVTHPSWACSLVLLLLISKASPPPALSPLPSP